MSVPVQTEDLEPATPANPGRLFVPLSDQPFRWFASGKKRWELRRLGRQYTRKHLVPGRRVELRRGYSDKATALWGTIEGVISSRNLTEFFDTVDFHLVIPDANSREEAIMRANAILGTQENVGCPVIGFQVEVDPTVTLPLDARYFHLVRTGKKRSTIRAGKRVIPLGVARLVGGVDSARVIVTAVETKSFSDLTEEDALRDGFESVGQLKRALHSFYPDIDDSKPMTVINFTPMEPISKADAV